MTSLAIFAALLAAVAALSFAGERSVQSDELILVFADAVQRADLELAPSRSAAWGMLEGVEVRAELVQSSERSRLVMRCVASLSPPLGLGLVARGADDLDAANRASTSELDVPSPRELTALALHPDLAEPLLAGSVGRQLCEMVRSGLEPRLRDDAAETWVEGAADSMRLFDALHATAELARLAAEERAKLPVAKRVRALAAPLADAARRLELPLEADAGAFKLRLEHGALYIQLERDGTRAITVLELVLDRARGAAVEPDVLTRLRALQGVQAARLADGGGVVLEIGHVSTDPGELVAAIEALDGLASGQAHERGPYR